MQRALQAVERKRQEEERRKTLAAQMVAGELPQDIAGRVYELLLKPDKNSTEWKALNDAASEVRMSPLRLMMKLGAVPDAFTWHVESFYRTNFPKGKGFTQAASEVPAAPGDLPGAAVEAFSVAIRRPRKSTTQPASRTLMAAGAALVFTSQRPH